MKMIKGKISSWNDEKGYGFIKSDLGGKDIFFHISEFSRKHKTPVEDLLVQYFISLDKNNRKCAIAVTPQKGHKKLNVASQQLKFSLVVSLIFFCLVGALVFYKRIPIIILYIYFTMSFLLFLLYAKDKSAAQKGKWRTPEATLHMFSLLGGWPGASIAQSKLRHKSKKVSFRIFFWLTVFLNCFGLGWLLTFEGSIFLQMFLDKIK